MQQERCPHYREVEYHDEPKDKTDESLPACAFPKPEKLELSANGGFMNGRNFLPPQSMQVYDGDENGENMDYPVEGECAIPYDVVFVTRKCLKQLCSGNQDKCARFIKTSDTSPNRRI